MLGSSRRFPRSASWVGLGSDTHPHSLVPTFLDAFGVSSSRKATVVRPDNRYSDKLRPIAQIWFSVFQVDVTLKSVTKKNTHISGTEKKLSSILVIVT